ncbi:hypothetical protein I7I50_01588 [Histoplasma capsulatum G186AR]|nr:hypothetical protein I7I50_01588 [Histoplasma capsulatum G186AR]
MSAGAVLSQLEALVARTELTASKLAAKKIRPTRDQLDDFQKLSDSFKAAFATVDAEVEKLLLAGQPTDEDINLMNQIRSTKAHRSITTPTLTIFRRNLVLIFTGPNDSSLDSLQVKARKKHTRARCEALRGQSPHVILMWALALPPSTWKTSGGMTDSTFNFLIEGIKMERINQLAPEILPSVQSLGKEEPLNKCDTFQAFTSILPGDQAGPSDVLRLSQRKRRRIRENPTTPDRGSQIPVVGTEQQVQAAIEMHPGPIAAKNILMQQGRRKQ